MLGGLTKAAPVAWTRAAKWARPASHAIMLAVVVYAVRQAILLPMEGGDAHAYWMARGDLYGDAVVGGPDAYLYSPAFAQALAPLQLLPWDAFHALWAAVTAGALVLMLGPLAALAMAVPPVAQEVLTLNVHLLIALAIVAGFRYPWAWAFVLLTKVLPGIGLLWFAVRGEWRNLAIALGATAAIVAVSFALAPSLWFDWIDVLLRSRAGTSGFLVPIALPVRLALAVVLVVWGARTDRRWTVPVAASFALPVMWIAGLAVMVGAVPLSRAGARGGYGSAPWWRRRSAPALDS